MRDQDIPLFSGDAPSEATESVDAAYAPIRRSEFLKSWLFLRGGETAVTEEDTSEEDEETDETKDKGRSSYKKRFSRLFRGLFSNVLEDVPTSRQLEETDKTLNLGMSKEVDLELAGAPLDEPGVIYARKDDKRPAEPAQNEESGGRELQADPEPIDGREKIEQPSPEQESLESPNDTESGTVDAVEDKDTINSLPTVEERQQELERRFASAANTIETSQNDRLETAPSSVAVPSNNKRRKSAVTMSPLAALSRGSKEVNRQVSHLRKQVNELKQKYNKDRHEPFKAYPYPPSEASIRKAIGTNRTEKINPATPEATLPEMSLRSEKEMPKKEVKTQIKHLEQKAVSKSENAHKSPVSKTNEHELTQQYNKVAKSQEVVADDSEARLEQIPEVVFERRHEILDQTDDEGSNVDERKVREIVKKSVTPSAVSVADVLASRSITPSNDVSQSQAHSYSNIPKMYAKSLQTGFFAGIIFIIIGLIAYFAR